MTKGDRIKHLREKSKKSQVELADLIGVSKQTLYKYENNIVTNIPSDKIEAIAKYTASTPEYIMGWTDKSNQADNKKKPPKSEGWIPVLGYVAAGIPIEAIENVLDWEQIDPRLLDSAEYFALEIKGDSMSPRIQEGDIVIIRVQPDIESGEIGIVQVNGDEATCKIVCKYRDQLTLKSINPAYGPLRYSINEMSDIPINILGKVVELRRKF